MEKRSRRKTWLIILAAVNLVVWVTLAGSVGLLASDRVDIGAESLFREFQGTAVAAIEELPRRLISPGGGSSSLSENTDRTGESDDSNASEAVIWPDSSTSSPASGSSSVGEASNSPLSTETHADGSLLASGEESAAAGSSPASSSASTSPGAPSGLLLLSDPDWQALGRMDAELRASAPGRPVQIRYSEATLNRQIAELLSYYPGQPYDTMVVDLERDKVSISGDVTVLGFQVGTEATGTVTAVNCLPQVRIESIKIAGLLTPGFVKDGVKDLIVDSLSQYPTSYPLCLEQIVVEEDRVTVYGSRRQ